MKHIQILGTGCSRCEALAQRARTVADKMGIQYELERVAEIDKILEFNVLTIPALVVDGQVKVAGRLPTSEELGRLLS